MPRRSLGQALGRPGEEAQPEPVDQERHEGREGALAPGTGGGIERGERAQQVAGASVDEAPRLGLARRRGQRGVGADHLGLLLLRRAGELVGGEQREGHEHEGARDDRDEADGAFDHRAGYRPPGRASLSAGIIGVVHESAHERLVEELRRHALIVGEVTLTSGRTAQYYMDAKRAILRPAGFLALGELVAAQAAEWGATAV